MFSEFAEDSSFRLLSYCAVYICFLVKMLILTFEINMNANSVRVISALYVRPNVLYIIATND